MAHLNPDGFMPPEWYKDENGKARMDMKAASFASKKEKNTGTWAVIRKNKAGYAMMLPYLLAFFVFTILPVLASMLYSLMYFNGFSGMQFSGLTNYIRLFLRDDVFLIALKNTLILAVITGPIGYLMCFGIAWLINELPPFVRAVMTLIFYAPSISGQVYLIWQILFSGDYYGVINSFLVTTGIISEPIQWLTDTRYMMLVVIVVQLWLSLGAGFLAFIAGFQGVDRSLYEAAAVDGVRNRFQEAWYITLPVMKPILLFSAVMQITASFSIGAVPIALTGFPSTDYATHTILTHLIDYGNTRFEIGYASAIAVVLFVMMVGANRLIQRFLKNIGN